MAADSPDHHLDIHALVDLDEQFFDQAAAGICPEKRQRRPLFQSGLWPAHPSERSLTAPVGRRGHRQSANHTQNAIRLFYRQLLAPGAAVLERSRRNNRLVNFGTLKTEARKAIDNGGGKATFDEAKDIRIRRRRRNSQPIADLHTDSSHGCHPPALCHIRRGKV